ncbi:hypothetical protein PENTCL1PPCAC_24494, partial [Pristionchus entomophagus]
LALGGIIVGADDVVALGVLLVALAAARRLGEAVLLESSEFVRDLLVQLLLVLFSLFRDALLAVGIETELLHDLSLSLVHVALAAARRPREANHLESAVLLRDLGVQLLLVLRGL